MFQEFVQRIGILASQVNANEFEMILREESQRLAGAHLEDPRHYDQDALEQLVSYWHNPLPNMGPCALLSSYERPRAWIEALRREIQYSKDDVDQDALLNACRRLVSLNDDPHPGLATWNEMCVRAVRDIRKAVG